MNAHHTLSLSPQPYTEAMTRKTILLTAFEPFGGETVNPTVRILERVTKPDGARLERLVLPVVFGRSLEVLESALEEAKPDVVIALGQAGGRSLISLERLAINLNDARIPDNDGNQPIDTPVAPDGPAAYFSTLPLKRMLRALLDDGIPADLSQTAGTFVCNHVMYGLLHLLSNRYPTARGGFIHVPFLPEQAAEHGAPSLGLGLMVRAVERCLAVCLTDELDIVMAAGQTH